MAPPTGDYQMEGNQMKTLLANTTALMLVLQLSAGIAYAASARLDRLIDQKCPELDSMPILNSAFMRHGRQSVWRQN